MECPSCNFGRSLEFISEVNWYDSTDQIWGISALLAQEESQDRETAEPGYLQISGCREEARASRAVF